MTQVTKQKPCKDELKAVSDAIKIGKDLIKKESTKSEASMAMYRILHEGECDQETIVDAFIEGTGLTPMGARTYYYNCRRKYKSEQRQKGASS